MSVLRPSGLDAFLRKPDPGIGAVLIYGDEPDAVRDERARVLRALPKAVHPFARIAIEPAAQAEAAAVRRFGMRKASI